jgi:lipopolysaccharide/colanic/teichoic acid biosynthesis glycosyltransferase
MTGEMPLVGPRPQAESNKVGDLKFHRLVDSYGSRRRVKPGLTGWAQVNGWRGETDTEEKLVKFWSMTYIILTTDRYYLILFLISYSCNRAKSAQWLIDYWMIDG